MIERLIIFGASGDLAGRFLLPGLAALYAAGRLPDRFEVLGTARAGWNGDGFRRYARERLVEHAAELPDASRDALIHRLHYRRLEATDPAGVARILGSSPVAVYLALPPARFAGAVTALADAGLPAGSRIAIEKPFGSNLDEAVSLNRLLTTRFGSDTEQTVFRVDHVLGLVTTQNLVTLRHANRVFEPIWNSDHIEEVELLWEETLALEGRAGYFDRAGTLKDVMQNHLMQLLSLVAMEPCGPGFAELRDHKLDVLRSVRTPDAGQMGSLTRRARYGPGRLSATAEGGREVPAYAEEDGVNPDRRTETFAEFVLRIDTPRWSGTRFRMRAGKALDRRRKEVVVHFRPAEALNARSGVDLPGNELRIGIDGPEDIALTLNGGASLPAGESVPLALEAPRIDTDLPAYARVLHDLLSGGTGLSVRGDEAEEAWRIVTPILDAWAGDSVPLEEYPAGSSGP